MQAPGRRARTADRRTDDRRVRRAGRVVDVALGVLGDGGPAGGGASHARRRRSPRQDGSRRTHGRRDRQRRARSATSACLPTDVASSRVAERRATCGCSTSTAGSSSRFTVDPANEQGALWSSDGRWIYYVTTQVGRSQGPVLPEAGGWHGRRRTALRDGGPSRRRAHRHLGRRATHAGARRNEPVHQRQRRVTSSRWTRHRSLTPVLTGPFVVRDATYSPDGRWMAYTSFESGTSQVYVVGAPGTTEQPGQVAGLGGRRPLAAVVGRRSRVVLPGRRVDAASEQRRPRRQRRLEVRSADGAVRDELQRRGTVGGRRAGWAQLRGESSRGCEDATASADSAVAGMSGHSLEPDESPGSRLAAGGLNAPVSLGQRCLGMRSVTSDQRASRSAPRPRPGTAGSQLLPLNPAHLLTKHRARRARDGALEEVEFDDALGVRMAHGEHFGADRRLDVEFLPQLASQARFQRLARLAFPPRELPGAGEMGAAKPSGQQEGVFSFDDRSRDDDGRNAPDSAEPGRLTTRRPATTACSVRRRRRSRPSRRCRRRRGRPRAWHPRRPGRGG